MASGDYVKTEFHNGAPPAINNTALNNNENKTKELDTDVALIKTRYWGSHNDGPGSGLDADTVSGYGIGPQDAPLVADLGGGTSIPLKNGIYYFGVSCANAPQADMVGTVYCSYTSQSSGRSTQLVVGSGSTYNRRIYTRAYSGGAWSQWDEVWNSYSDGNGGQPPAPKPNLSTNTSPGFTTYVNGPTNSPLVIPGISTERFWGYVFTQNDATGVVDPSGTGVLNNGVGGATWLAASPGNTHYAFFWRVL